MPKRKHSKDDDNDDRLLKKIRRMEKKLKRRRRRLRRRRSDSTSSTLNSSLSPDNNLSIASANEDVANLLLPAYNEEATIDFEEFHPPDESTCNAFITESNPGPSTPELVSEPAANLAPKGATEVVSEHPSTPVLPSTSANQSEENEIVLDAEILTFLGEAPNKAKKFGPKIQADIASRWEHVATSGLSKENKKDLIEKYLTPENCQLIDPPLLNLEVKAALSENLQKKDVAIQNKQKEISAAISCIGLIVKKALCQSQKDSEMIKMLIDAGRIVSDIQHTESMMRRGFIGSYIKKEVKDHLYDTKIDQYLFGQALAETLKAAKSIQKSGSEIRNNSNFTRTVPKNKPMTRPLNLKGPAATNRLPPAGRRYEEPARAPPPPRRRAPPPLPPAPPAPPAPRSQTRTRPPRR